MSVMVIVSLPPLPETTTASKSPTQPTIVGVAVWHPLPGVAPPVLWTAMKGCSVVRSMLRVVWISVAPSSSTATTTSRPWTCCTLTCVAAPAAAGAASSARIGTTAIWARIM